MKIALCLQERRAAQKAKEKEDREAFRVQHTLISRKLPKKKTKKKADKNSTQSESKHSHIVKVKRLRK